MHHLDCEQFAKLQLKLHAFHWHLGCRRQAFHLESAKTNKITKLDKDMTKLGASGISTREPITFPKKKSTSIHTYFFIAEIRSFLPRIYKYYRNKSIILLLCFFMKMDTTFWKFVQSQIKWSKRQPR